MHKGRTAAIALGQLQELASAWGEAAICRGSVTGQGSKGLGRHQQITWINESTALAAGSRHWLPQVRSVVGIGGQSAVYMTHLEKEDAAAMVVSMNAQCAAGTGAFLEEQVSRLGIPLEDYSRHAAEARQVPAIAGRCSVFAKTDIIHHQQEGVPVAAILQGLAHALVKNYRANVVKKHPLKTPLLLTGGVARHQAIVKALITVLHLKEAEVVVAPDCGSVTALGAALEGLKGNWSFQMSAFKEALEALENPANQLPAGGNTSASTSPQSLSLRPLAGFGQDDSHLRHEYLPLSHSPSLRGYLGIDIGSTSTNVVFMDEDRHIRSFQYLRTKGDPLEAVRQGLALVAAHLGERLTVLGVGTTGSGRQLAGKYAGADAVMDEITAQAAAAQALDPQVDTIIEIGGQDSKFIRMEGGRVTDFEMNKICAAGTGSFIEEQAKKLNLSMEDFSPLALQASQPADLGDRCTVFIETSIAAALSRQEPMANIAAGLAYAIARNYLYKVVGQKQLGERILLQGGVAHNQAVVNAFRSLLGDRTVLVPPFFSVTGAYGAALLTQAQQQSSLEQQALHSQFRGFHLEPGTAFMAGIAAASPSPAPSVPPQTKSMAQAVEAHYLAGYDPAPNPAKKTVGIPRVLFLHKLFPLFNTFFKELGFRVVLSEKTHGETVTLSQEHALDETCYPIKLINGHVAQLMAQGIDYLFLPSLYTMAHPVSTTRQNYGCVYMQCFPRLVAQTMNLDAAGVKLLSPALSFEFGKQYMMKTLLEMGKNLGKNQAITALALAKGMKALKTFEKQVETLGSKALSSLDQEPFAFVIITRAYGVSDPVLNMGIPQKLEKMGYRVLTLSHLPAHDLDTANEHPNLYWPFGQHILSGARLVKEHPRLVPIYLTNHGCGPDTVLLHYFREMMEDRPFLHLEVDEHFSDVGVLTRLEAFVNSLKNHYQHQENQQKAGMATPHPPAKEAFNAQALRTQALDAQAFKVQEPADASELLQRARLRPLPPVNIHHRLNPPAVSGQWLIPPLYPYADLLAAYLKHQGINARVLPMTNRQTLSLGRQQTLTKEAVTFAALAGDVLAAALERQEHRQQKQTQDSDAAVKNRGFLIPTSQGAEVGGQYHRLIRQKLDAAGAAETPLWAPFTEDLVNQPQYGLPLFRLVVAGDLVNLAPVAERPALLHQMITAVGPEGIHPRVLEKTARLLAAPKAGGEASRHQLSKGLVSTGQAPTDQASRARVPRLLALGEVGMLYNDHLNHHILKTMEEEGIQVTRAPLSEALWLLWHDTVHQAGKSGKEAAEKNETLNQCASLLKNMHRFLGANGLFEEDPARLVQRADEIMGLYAGGFGRYRAAKMLGSHSPVSGAPDTSNPFGTSSTSGSSTTSGISGIVTLASLYENTGTILNIRLSEEVLQRQMLPVLNLALDAEMTETDQAKIDTCVYALKHQQNARKACII